MAATGGLRCRFLLSPQGETASGELVPLEILHRAFVLFGRRARLEGAEIAALAGLRVRLARIEPVFAGSEFADHADFHETTPEETRRGRLVPG